MLQNAQDERAIDLALYIVEHGATVRAAASRFGISKSTVHSDVAKRLRRIDRRLWILASGVLQKNKSERHLRGGAATRERYRALAEKKRKT